MSVVRPELPQEEDRVPVATILVVTIGTIVFGVLLCVWAWGTLFVRQGQLRPGRVFTEKKLGPPHTVAGVREHVFNGVDESGARLAAQRLELQSYKWVDRDKGIVAIPIERAIDLIAARGAQGGIR